MQPEQSQSMDQLVETFEKLTLKSKRKVHRHKRAVSAKGTPGQITNHRKPYVEDIEDEKLPAVPVPSVESPILRVGNYRKPSVEEVEDAEAPNPRPMSGPKTLLQPRNYQKPYSEDAEDDGT